MLPHPLFLATSQMKMQFVRIAKNTLGTKVRRITRHSSAENTARRVPGTCTGAVDLDYEGNMYTEKRVM